MVRTKKQRGGGAKSPHTGYFPCCNGEVKVTQRKSKLAQRGRYHTCGQCGQLYTCTVVGSAVVFTKR